MLSIPIVNDCYIIVLQADLSEFPRSKILIVFKAIGKLPKSVIFFVLSIPLVGLYSYLCLVFY